MFSRIIVVGVLAVLIPVIDVSAQSSIAGAVEDKNKQPIVIRSVDIAAVPIKVDVAIHSWIEAVLVLGDAHAVITGPAEKLLNNLNTPERFKKLAADRRFTMPDSALSEIVLTKEGTTYVASPLTFIGEITKDGAVYQKPSVFRVHLNGTSAKVIRVEEIPYYRLAPVNQPQLMLPRDLYDLIDQSGSLIRQYQAGYETQSPEHIARLMTDDVLTWTITVDQARRLSAASRETDAFLDRSKVVSSKSKRRNLGAYVAHLARIMASYDSISLNVDESKNRLFRHAATDGGKVDVLEFYQEYKAFQGNRLVYHDEGYTTFLLTNVTDGEHEGRKVIRKFWSLSGIIVDADQNQIVPRDSKVIPVVVDMFD